MLGRVKVLFGFLADAANQTTDGKLNVLGVFATIGAPSFPATRPLAHVVVRVELSSPELGGKYPIKLIQLDEDGIEVSRLEADFTPHLGPNVAPTLNSVADLIFPVQIPMPKAGSYHFSVMMQGEEKARVPFSAILVS